MSYPSEMCYLRYLRYIHIIYTWLSSQLISYLKCYVTDCSSTMCFLKSWSLHVPWRAPGPDASNILKKWQSRSHLESHSPVVLLVQPGEPLPKHYGSPRKPWYSLQLDTAPMSGAEAHMLRRLTSSSTATDHIWLSQADTCVSAPYLSRDIPVG